jgi:hypothetical protein
MSPLAVLENYLREGEISVSPLIDFKKGTDKLVLLDLTATNKSLSESIFSNTGTFCDWINLQIGEEAGCYGIGGYTEHRVIYSRSEHFGTDEERRIVHLGTDIWAPEGTVIFSPLDASVHSFNFNDNLCDYGGTIILRHQHKTLEFYSLYGHLSVASLDGLWEGKRIKSGEKLGDLGNILENGNWPPHLHFQLIFDLEGMKGDYPGVCKVSEKAKYLANCPDPEIILRYTFE